ncbi:MAG: hypothetical protein HQK49_13555 [Oligoflexia bacterium]|nr:hypothetical protein [Oligoflexia bacterium]
MRIPLTTILVFLIISLLISVSVISNFLFYSIDSYAANKPFRITNINTGNVPTGGQADILGMFTAIEDDVNAKLPSADTSTYPSAMANSQAIALKGLGTDYATNPDIFIVGAGVGLGADTGPYKLGDLMSGSVDLQKFKGVGLQVSIMAGMNLKFFDDMPVLFDLIDFKKMSLFVNYMSYNLPSIKNLTGKLSSFGMHVQYKIYDGFSVPVFFKWGGLDITTGFDHGSTKISMSQDYAITKNKDVADSSSILRTVVANFTGKAVVESDVSVTTIPLEISTNAQFLYVLTLFGGLGMDFNTGSSKIAASLVGPITARDETNTINGISADASLNLGNDGKPNSYFARYFVGTQFNLWVVKVYTQLNHAIGEDLWGLNVGARIAF